MKKTYDDYLGELIEKIDKSSINTKDIEELEKKTKKEIEALPELPDLEKENLLRGIADATLLYHTNNKDTSPLIDAIKNYAEYSEENVRDVPLNNLDRLNYVRDQFDRIG